MKPTLTTQEWRHEDIPEIEVARPVPASLAAQLNSSKPKLELPCAGRLVSAFAEELGHLLKGRGMYERGGAAFVVNVFGKS
jgi:hypothetical protein